MLKMVLISFYIIGLIYGSEVKVVDPNMAGNYDHIELFLSSFMNNYTHTQYNMSTCLTPKTQANLDQILASSLGYLILLDFDQVLQSYEQFLISLADACEICGLNQVEMSLKQGMSEKSKVWFEINLAYNSEKILNLVESLKGELELKHYIEAGGTLGTITSILIPFNPPHKLSLNFDQSIYLSWWKGFIYTLSINPKKPGPCYAFLSKFANQTINPAMDISLLIQGKLLGFNNLFGDLAKSLTFVKTNYTDVCMLDQLEANFIELFSKAGVEELFARYVSRALSINTSILNIKNCQMSFYACGQGVGTLIKYLLNWSIN
ncbi:hypothetical protein SteCoe_16783 [Stentor coeruleus]|uniref:Uncharacterized protein n=1 Tax=Stentor coeruleus TaxID=5963 RepID=A0A1R2C0F9_9CILI|nr:hypothetical protein SteCoe_16783 [Stentor coeruleus]